VNSIRGIHIRNRVRVQQDQNIATRAKLENNPAWRVTRPEVKKGTCKLSTYVQSIAPVIYIQRFER
jgi:hypothetical protein